MKVKFTLVLMAMFCVTTMQAQMTTSKAEGMRAMQDRSSDTTVGIPLQDIISKAPAKEEAITYPYMWDFNADEGLGDWSLVDADGDGYNWELTEGVGVDGSRCVTSRSYINNDVGGVTPDNWLVSPKVRLKGVLSMWIKNYMSAWKESFVVYVCVGDMNIENMVAISDTISPPDDWTEYTYDLAEYGGAEGYFAVRHCASYDCYRLHVDNVSLQGPPIEIPSSITVTPATTTADVAWEDSTNVAWNLRYREIPEGSEDNLLWDFEEDTQDNTNVALTGGWTCIDADGDGSGWYHLNGDNFKTHSGGGHVTSASWSGSPLTPDNWLVSPEVKLDGTLSFWACGQDSNYPEEKFAVYVSTTIVADSLVADTTNIANFTMVSEEFTATGEMTEYTVDLSAYEGQMGYVAIRHYDVTDMFRLNVDDIAITYVPLGDWITVENVTSPYTIEGLTPNTTYEVQVQGINGEGATSDWPESVYFTTLADEPTAIEGVSESIGTDNVWYNISGQKMVGKPVEKGVYINNGKKIVVR